MKFPRTPHIPGSRGTEDDLYSEYSYDGAVVITEKMDGSNIMMNKSKFITRSGKMSGADWVYPIRNLHFEVGYKIPEGYWLAGEFLYWRKSVEYENLPSIYMVFGAMKGNTCLAWDEVNALAADCGLPVAPVITENDDPAVAIADALRSHQKGMEGFVIRPQESFPLPRYQEYVAKWVNSDHVAVATNNGVNGFLNS